MWGLYSLFIQALRDGVPDKDGNSKGGYKYTQNAAEIFTGFFGEQTTTFACFQLSSFGS